jgi:hypothetical protein
MFAFDTKEGISLNELCFFLQDQTNGTHSLNAIYTAVSAVKNEDNLHPKFLSRDEVTMSFVNILLKNRENYDAALEEIETLNIPSSLKNKSVDIVERFENLDSFDDIIASSYKRAEESYGFIRKEIDFFGGVEKLREMISFVLSLDTTDYEFIYSKLEEKYC